MQLELLLPGRQSLKAKRQGLRQIKDRVLHTFHLPLVELDHQDVWQRTTLGCAMVAANGGDARAFLEKMSRFVEDLHVGEVIRRELDIIECL